MSIKSPSLSKHVLALTAIASVLIVGGCNRADKGQAALKSNEMAALNLDRTDAKVFAKHFELKSCETDEMEALGALAGLGLGESGDSGVRFSNRSIDGTTVKYTDLKVRDEDADVDAFAADKATFHCAGMRDDGPTFDRLDLEKAIIRDEDVTFTFDTLNISQPTSEAAAALMDGMMGPVTEHRAGNIGFGGISLTGATMSGEGFKGTLQALAWGEERQDDMQGFADMMMEKMEMTFQGQESTDVTTLSFDGMSARNLAVGGVDASNVTTSGMVGSVIDGFTLLKKPYDSFIIGSLSLDNPAFKVDFDGVDAEATENGNVVTIHQRLNPVTVNIDPSAKDDAVLGRHYDRIETLGFETMRFSGSSVTTLNKDDDSLTVRDGLFVMEDAFRLNFEYSAEGLNDMVATMRGMSDLELRQNPMKPYDAVKLRSLRITLEDNSITDRGLKLASDMTGQSESAVKRMLGVAVLGAALAAQNDVQAEVYAETAEAFANFVKDGGTLTIVANPETPFPISALMSGGDDIDPDTLGFSAVQAD